MVRNFEKFEKDHWYIYTGNESLSGWSNDGLMDEVLKHKPHQVITADETYASFSNVTGGVWKWESGFDNWVEIEPMDYILQKGDDVINVNSIYKNWVQDYAGKPQGCGNVYALKKQKETKSKIKFSNLKYPCHIINVNADVERIETITNARGWGKDVILKDAYVVSIDFGRKYNGRLQESDIRNHKPSDYYHSVGGFPSTEYNYEDILFDVVTKKEIKIEDLKVGMKVKLKNDPRLRGDYQGKIITIKALGNFNVQDEDKMITDIKFIESIIEENSEPIHFASIGTIANLQFVDEDIIFNFKRKHTRRKYIPVVKTEIKNTKYKFHKREYIKIIKENN